jgi:ferritin-like metal-binding protein YciE
LLGHPDCASLLEQNLAEEIDADKSLSEIAEGSVNQRAPA